MNGIKKRTPILIIHVLAILLWMSTVVQAESAKDVPPESYQLESIKVTAERHAENLQNVSVSVTGFTETQIKDADIRSMDDLARETPNLQWFEYGSRFHQFSVIRGMVTIPMQEPAMGFYVDDVAYLDSMSFSYPLFDIERIEVLRGPQGTLYGRNTLGGAINIITRKPDNNYMGEVSLGYGNYKHVNVNAGVRGPVVNDKLFLGLSGFYEARDGFYENDFLKNEDDGRDGKGLRSVMNWIPTDRLDMSLTLQAQKHDDSAYINGLQEVDAPFHYQHNRRGKHDSDVWTPTFCLKYSGSNYKLTSITGWLDQEVEERYDIDLTSADIWYGTNDRATEAFTQEIRVATPDKDRILSWIAGAYYFNKNYEESMSMSTVSTDSSILRSADRDKRGFAFFGQGNYKVFKKLDFTFGLRYEYENMDSKIRKETLKPLVNGSITPLHDPYDISSNSTTWLPKFSAAYHWSPSLMTYGTISRGYRAGGANSMAPDNQKMSFAPEYSWNYELGLKSQWFDNHLLFNTSFFYIKITDEQVSVHADDYITYLENAGESYRMGAEFEIKARPLQGLDLIAGASFLEAEYEKYDNGIMNFKDLKIAQAPEFTGNFAAQLRRPIWKHFDLFTRIDYFYNSKVYFDADNSLEEPHYKLFDLKLGLESDVFDIHFWVKNAFDETYRVYAYAGMEGKIVDEYGSPRTFGVSITTRF